MDTAPGEQLLKAARKGNIERVGTLLDQDVEVDCQDDRQWTPLIWACFYGRGEVATLLLDREANVNAESAAGDTPAIFASTNGHLDILKLLVSRGANIHHIYRNGYSPLYCAAEHDHLPVCEYLISLGMDMAWGNDDYHVLGAYGAHVDSPLSPETKALRRTILQRAWENGPHPSQVQRRRDECWARRGPLLMVLAEHSYRPLQLRSLLILQAAAEPSAPIQPVALVTRQQRHAYLMGRVFSCEGIVRLLAAML
jgi:ankyrin repeat protein